MTNQSCEYEALRTYGIRTVLPLIDTRNGKLYKSLFFGQVRATLGLAPRPGTEELPWFFYGQATTTSNPVAMIDDTHKGYASEKLREGLGQNVNRKIASEQLCKPQATFKNRSNTPLILFAVSISTNLAAQLATTMPEPSSTCAFLAAIASLRSACS